MIHRRTGASAKVSKVAKKPKYKLTTAIPGIAVQTSLTKEQIKKMGELSDSLIKEVQEKHKMDNPAIHREVTFVMINAVRLLENKEASNEADAIKKAKAEYLKERKKKLKFG